MHQETADVAVVAVTAWLFGDQTGLRGSLLPNKVKTLRATCWVVIFTLS